MNCRRFCQTGTPLGPAHFPSRFVQMKRMDCSCSAMGRLLSVMWVINHQWVILKSDGKRWPVATWHNAALTARTIIGRYSELCWEDLCNMLAIQNWGLLPAFVLVTRAELNQVFVYGYVPNIRTKNNLLGVILILKRGRGPQFYSAHAIVILELVFIWMYIILNVRRYLKKCAMSIDHDSTCTILIF